jgi:ribosomal protein L37E
MSRSPHHLVALAAEFEREGQYNAAKLVRAAAISSINRNSTKSVVPTEAREQAAELREIADGVAATAAASLADPLRAAAAALEAGNVALYADAPDPFVCRICGHVAIAPFTDRCDECGRWPTTAERIRPIYWARASTPHEALEMLANAPETVRSILADGDAGVAGPDGGWSAHQTLEHLNNAQGIFRGRIDQLVSGGDPELASVLVWRMDGGELTTEALFGAYSNLREEIVDLLSGLDPIVWWNTGRHEEFGRVTLAEQASYFANHEPTHLAQLADAMR